MSELDTVMADLYREMYDHAEKQNRALMDCIRALCKGEPDAAKAAIRPYVSPSVVASSSERGSGT